MKFARALFLLLTVFFQICPNVWAMEFFYKFTAGDKYRIVGTVIEDVYVDRKLTYKAEIITRISMEVTEVTGDRARQTALFQSAEKTVVVGDAVPAADPFQWSKDYESEFEQDKLGYMTIDEHYYMPMVRNVPVFPARELKAGETWSAEGIEVHDFRDSYGIEKPYRIPFTANYTYLGERTWKDEEYPAFSVSYRIFLEPDAVPGKVYPRRIQGASDQVVYWDVDHGQAAAYEEHFRTIIDLSDGQTWEYRGRAEAEIVEAPPMNKEEIAKDIAEEIAAFSDVSVRVSDEGIVISLENIQFAPDSAVLRASERPKLDLVAEILMKYPDRDILVGGHTAMAGTAAGRLQLSQERAASVANYLMSKNVRTPDRVVIRGYGADQPIADNRTAEGMARNRRVEITILEN
ncbi:MAG: OmpA family protein [Treponema sp.]|jgi:outer membrane protein OmpA-like peptidoglycan-associated protein|nr:OmpA family protein [Treponema sp.]